MSLQLNFQAAPISASPIDSSGYSTLWEVE